MSDTPKMDKQEVAQSCGVKDANAARSIAMGYADENGMHTQLDRTRLATKEQMQCINNGGSTLDFGFLDSLKGKLCEKFGVACGSGEAAERESVIEGIRRDNAKMKAEQVNRVVDGGGPARETVRSQQVAEIVDNGGNPNGQQVGGPRAAGPAM